MVLRIDLLQQIVVPQLSCGWQHNHPTKTRQAGCADVQSIHFMLSVYRTLPFAGKMNPP